MGAPSIIEWEEADFQFCRFDVVRLPHENEKTPAEAGVHRVSENADFTPDAVFRTRLWETSSCRDNFSSYGNQPNHSHSGKGNQLSFMFSFKN